MTDTTSSRTSSSGSTKPASVSTDPDRARISVLCVDDNEPLARSLRVAFDQDGGFEWKGWLSCADDLVPTARRISPAVILIDIDMPGRDPYDALEELAAESPECRAVVFSGHVRYELVDRALGSGAWGYVAKTDGAFALLDAIRTVLREEVALSPEARTCYERGPS